MTEIDYRKSLAWMKTKGRHGTPPDPASVDMRSRYDFAKDSQGRDIAIPLFDARAEGWEKVCLRFGYNLPLIPEEKLTPYHKLIRDQMARGQSNALLYGPPGTGKTTVGLLALRELYYEGRSVLAARFSTIKTQMEPRYCDAHDITPQELLEGYHDPEFLMIDELGYGDYRKETTEHERRVFFDLISPRHGLGKRTWLLSNISREDLYQLYGEGPLSRIDTVGECVVADFQGRINFRLEPQNGAKNE